MYILREGQSYFFSGSKIGILVGKGKVGSCDVEIACVVWEGINAVQTDNVFGLEINQ